MIGTLTKEDEGTKYLYLVLNDFKESETLRFIPKGSTYEAKTSQDNPDLKFLYKYRSAFIPPEMLEINEILKKYPVVKSVISYPIQYIVVEKEVIKEVKVTYIPIYTDIKNWLFPNKPKQVKIIDNDLSTLFKEGLSFNKSDTTLF